MRLLRRPGGCVMAKDDWEIRAVALAAQLDKAAEELRRLVEDWRRDDDQRSEEEESDERPES